MSRLFEINGPLTIKKIRDASEHLDIERYPKESRYIIFAYSNVHDELAEAMKKIVGPLDHFYDDFYQAYVSDLMFIGFNMQGYKNLECSYYYCPLDKIKEPTKEQTFEQRLNNIEKQLDKKK